MKFINSLAAAALFVTCTLAAQSPKFYLVLHSDNSTLNGKTLNACHEGAAIEGLCLSTPLAKANPEFNRFQFNYTKSDPNDGILTFELIGGNFKESQGMQLYAEASTNVGIALFEPSYSDLYISFDSNNFMYIKSYYMDTKNPPTSGKVQKLKRWHMCKYDYSGYTYEVLCWVYGKAKPQNPTCQEVGVQRVFKK